MNERTRLVAAVGGTVLLFLCVQLGALALVEPYVAAGAQPVEDPSDPGNVGLFFGVILVATAAMLAAIKFGLERLIRAFVLFACGWVTWLVISTLVTPLAPVDPGTTGQTIAAWLVFLLPVAVGGLLVVALFVHPEWYVIDAAGVLLGAGAAGLFGYAFQPHLTVAFLVVLAVYDAVSVYGTEHMLTLAEGVSDLDVPVLLVVPTTFAYSLQADEGPASLEAEGTEEGATGNGGGSSEAPAQKDSEAATGTDAGTATQRPDSAEPEATEQVRDAIYIGLGDAVMPTILVTSAAYFLQTEAPLYDLPLIALNAPALGALVGTLVGLVVLLWFVLKGRAHAGLPMLNGGAIGGYLIGAALSGITIVEALGLPF